MAPQAASAADVTVNGSPSGVPDTKGGDATGVLPPPGAADTYNKLTVYGGSGGGGVTGPSGAAGGDASATGATSAPSAAGNEIDVYPHGGDGGFGDVFPAAAGPGGAIPYSGDATGGAAGNVTAATATGKNKAGLSTSYVAANAGQGGGANSFIEGIPAHGGDGGTATGVSAIATGVRRVSAGNCLRRQRRRRGWRLAVPGQPYERRQWRQRRAGFGPAGVRRRPRGHPSLPARLRRPRSRSE